MAIIVLAGLVMLPGDVYEAAEMDGASGWYTFWHITLPLLRPTIALAVMFRMLQAFGLFDLPYVMTGGGPGHVDPSRWRSSPTTRCSRTSPSGLAPPWRPAPRCWCCLAAWPRSGCSGSRSDRKATDMRNRKRIGWHSYINLVTISTLVTALFILSRCTG